MIKRILKIMSILIITSLIAFTVTRIIPGDPRIAYLNTFNLPLSEENLRYIEKEMGLDIPIYKQYFIWIKNIITLKLGKSYINGMDVYLYIKDSFFYTLKLMSFSLFLIVIVSLFLGIISAFCKNIKVEKFIRILCLVGVSSPKFWVAYIFIYFFGVKLKILPISGAYTKWSIILPSITLSLSYIAYYTQFIKENILIVLKKDFIKYAKLRKISSYRIIIFYALLNSMVPIITSLGKTIAGLLGGSVIIENIFSWPGLGKMVVEAIDGRDYPVIQSYIFLVSIFFVIFTEISNMFCYYINPKIRENEK